MHEMHRTSSERGTSSFVRLAFIGNHTPRRCGIATFTADLAAAIQNRRPKIDCVVVAMNDVGKRYAYPEQVQCQIQEETPASYRSAADYLNINEVDLVSLQHEYGIFGGKSGAHVVPLLRALRMPIVTTLHTVLSNPNSSQREVMDEICGISTRLVVMSASGAELLQRVHAVPAEKIDVIHHGIPFLPGTEQSKTKLGLNGRRILLTFGLLSPDKGIEYVIDALVSIIAQHPDVVYVVLGATHPHVKERHGESYRLMLEARGHRLGLDDHLAFHDRFVKQGELVQFLAAADVYVTPYLNPEQISSGALAYAVGSGKAVVSSTYRYAEELLSEGRGLLVQIKDSGAIANAILAILGDESLKKELERRAAAVGRNMVWPAVAETYLKSFERARSEHAARPPLSVNSKARAVRVPVVPELNLSHLRTMTDDTGILQHAIHAVPRYEDGYCLDDNARALIVLALVEEARLAPPSEVSSLSTRYLAFVLHAFDPLTGRFRNFMSYSRRWLEPIGSEDSHGRALWALGTLSARGCDAGRRAIAGEFFDGALAAVDAFTSPRAWAYVLLGIGERIQGDGLSEPYSIIGRRLAERLLELFRRVSGDDWRWYEQKLTYCNARLPQALMVAGTWLKHEEMVSTGLTSLNWLAELQTMKSGLFAPIGSNGFFTRGGNKAAFDQQPVEACSMIAASAEAYRITGHPNWGARALAAFDWFLGENQLRQWLYDVGTGGCRDGLHQTRRNENQGAESTLSFLMALLDARHIDRSAQAEAKKNYVGGRLAATEGAT